MAKSNVAPKTTRKRRDPQFAVSKPPLTGKDTGEAAAPNVGYVLPEVSLMDYKWTIIEDCLAGQETIKNKGKTYLPIPNPSDKSTENVARYDNYVARAVFYGVVANTTAGLVGQVFNTDPVSEYPPELEGLWFNADGRGISLVQQSKRVLTSVISMGRSGLLADHPPGKADGTPFTREDVNKGIARAKILLYGPRSIINWRYTQFGALSKLSLVVLAEDFVTKDDGFEIQTGKEWRVLRLTEEGVYTTEVWRRRDDDPEGGFVIHQEAYAPTDSAGKTFDYIPFYFIGSQDNDADIDKPPMYDMAELNLAHYRNSADYEDAVFMLGQPTPFFAGLTASWVTDVLKGTIQLGSRGAVPLPEGGSAGLIQASENTMVKEAMDKKEQQMVAIGAQLIEEKQVQRTLGEAQMEHAVVASTLATCANNVSQAYELALGAAAQFMGLTKAADNTEATKKIVYKLSTDFAISKMTPDERRQLLTEWQGGLVSFSEARSQLRQSGVATLDDTQARSEIEKDQETAIDLAAREFEATGGAAEPKPGGKAEGEE